MAASDAQKLATRLALKVELSQIETALDALTADELTELDEMLAGYDKVKYRAADLNQNGVIVSADKQRSLYIDSIWSLLGEYPNSFKIGRA